MALGFFNKPFQNTFCAGGPTVIFGIFAGLGSKRSAAGRVVEQPAQGALPGVAVIGRTEGGVVLVEHFAENLQIAAQDGAAGGVILEHFLGACNFG